MSDPRIVDVHVHLFQQADDPMRDGYEIWEYGDHDDVDFGTRRGTVGDLAASLGEPPVAHCVVVGMFVPGAGDRLTPAADRLRSYNDWVLASGGHLPPPDGARRRRPVRPRRSGGGRLPARVCGAGRPRDQDPPHRPGLRPDRPPPRPDLRNMCRARAHRAVALGPGPWLVSGGRPLRLRAGHGALSGPPPAARAPGRGQLEAGGPLRGRLSRRLLRSVRDHRLDRSAGCTLLRRTRSSDPRDRISTGFCSVPTSPGTSSTVRSTS